MNEYNYNIIKELIFNFIKSNKFTDNQLSKEKSYICAKYNIKDHILNSQILFVYKDLIKKNILKKNIDIFNIFKKRKIRSLSGISSITVLTKPYKCKSKCLYCPSQNNIPKSYISNEPAVQRAISVKYNAFKQVLYRVNMYITNGHPIDKIEIIILGGTFLDYPKVYTTNFVKNIYKALNSIDKKNNKKNINNLKKLQDINKSTKCKVVGLTIETRPDTIDIKNIKYLRKLGVTKIELGVQNLYDDILKKNNRSSDLNDIINSTKLLKDSGFKICYHMMLNMPFSDIKKDYKQFEILFNDQNFKPDYLKIYPCVVSYNKVLENMVKNGTYKLYTDKQLIDLLIKIKKIVPRYVRIIRIYRDIPSDDIVYGSKLSNIRQYLKSANCQCIRCREILNNKINKIKLNRYDYDASDGKEIFLTIDEENLDKLITLLRLRIPSNYFLNQKHFLKELNDCAIIRELHTYGYHIEVGKYEKETSQHRGYGKILLNEIEKIVKNEFNLNKIAVISAVGTRNYYKKFGYKLVGDLGYMVKKI